MNPVKNGAIVCALLCASSFAQFTYPGCSNLASTDFQTTELFNKTGSPSALATNSSLTEPVQFDVQGVMNAAGDSVLYTNIYFVEHTGRVKFYDGLAKRVDSIGYIPNWVGTSTRLGGTLQNDNGLMGIVLDPNFNTNHWMYLWYTPPVANTASNTTINRHLRLSRFTLTAQNTVDMTSEKNLLDILGSKTDQWHCGGPMTFDSNGDLWITVGNNSNDVDGSGSQLSTTDSNKSAEWGSSNTHSMRGGVLRIHPDNSAKGYTVPSGNFGDYWAQQFLSQGNAAMAAQYADTSKVLPEVYVKGTRSNYSITIHPTKHWLAWGEVLYNSSDDEFNLVTHPAFMGFPYFMANNAVVPRGTFPAQNPATPVNNSPFNSGVVNLPPATQPLVWFGTSATINTLPQNVAIGGPIYLYDRNLKSNVKFPPHLDNSWIFMSWQNSTMYIGLLDTNPVLKGVPQLQVSAGGSAYPAASAVHVTLRNPLQAKYGPDGALYVLNYGSTSVSSGSAYSTGNPGITRVSYAGNCVLAPAPIAGNKPNSDLKISISPEGLTVNEKGVHEFSLYNLAGARLLIRTGEQGAHYSFAKLRGELGLKKGLYIAQVKSARGSITRNVAVF